MYLIVFVVFYKSQAQDKSKRNLSDVDCGVLFALSLEDAIDTTSSIDGSGLDCQPL